MRTKPPLKEKPEYKGSAMWRTGTSANKQMFKCVGCTRFATHTGFMKSDNTRVYACPTHTRKFTTANVIHKVEPFLEYKKYLADTEQWKQQQQTTEQEALF